MNLQMGNIKEINIKNRTYYFFYDMINISSVMIEGIKAVLFFFLNEKIGTNKSVKVSSYIRTFVDLFSPISFRLKE